MTPPARITAPASRRRGPASTENGRRSRDRVLEAAVELITEAGIDQVRVAEIARRARMSSGQVMYYFTSKEHILLEALAWRDHQDLVADPRRAGQGNRRLQQLDGSSASTCPRARRTRAGSLDGGMGRAPHNRQVSQFLEVLLALWRDDLAAIVERGVQAGASAPPANIDDFTLRFAALLDGLAILRLRQMHQPSRERLIELAMTTARAELTPDAAAAPAG